MPKTKKRSGICSTCKNAATCVYLAGARQPVLQCEEFDPGEVSRTRKTPKAFPPKGPSPASQADGEPPIELMGLCVDCENRHACTYLKPEGGVWHCEEYR